MSKISILWLRRDLRLHDHAALYRALRGPHPVLPLFIFDTTILDALPDPADPRVTFIYDTIQSLHQQLRDLGSTLLVQHGQPLQVWHTLLQTHDVAAVYTNADYEPSALQRDQAIQAFLAQHHIPFHTYKDHLIFSGDEVLKDDGKPYTVFTPYSRKWLTKLESRPAIAGAQGSFYLQSYPSTPYLHHLAQVSPSPLPDLQQLGFQRSTIAIPPIQVPRERIRHYADTRDFPAIEGTSRLGIHYRFGTISIREKARSAQTLSAIYLKELIWRDFYSMILQHFPYVATGAFRPEYKQISWRNNETEFKAWCQGKTGYPIVDAGMRELNTTGYMHNRVRMIVASFLTKHLLIDWRWGEAYFAEKLLDFDLASNNGGWQWAAGCGTDAAPYFRIFNPDAQQAKFDKDLRYTRHWVPELGTPAYPKPIVNHALARERCLKAYQSALKSQPS